MSEILAIRSNPAGYLQILATNVIGDCEGIANFAHQARECARPHCACRTNTPYAPLN